MNLELGMFFCASLLLLLFYFRVRFLTSFEPIAPVSLAAEPENGVGTEFREKFVDRVQEDARRQQKLSFFLVSFATLLSIAMGCYTFIKIVSSPVQISDSVVKLIILGVDSLVTAKSVDIYKMCTERLKKFE